jgi:Kef-type K+ transport system membrane component KefB
MSPFLQLAFELVIILLAAKAAGYLATRLGQPSVLGELIAGVLLGPSLINILGLPFISSTSLGDTVSELSQLGVLLLMFLAGTSQKSQGFPACQPGGCIAISLIGLACG